MVKQMSPKTPAELGQALTAARVKAGLTRIEARDLVGVTAQIWTNAEQGLRDTTVLQDWISQLEALHTPIDVDMATKPTPANVRSLRVQAGLTKPEAARLIGVSSGAAFHNYESGRMHLPSDRWQVFLGALKSGSFRNFLTGAYRRGPRENDYFEPGQKLKKPRPHKVDGGDVLILAARSALRISGDQMAEIVKVPKGMLYAIEAGRRSVSLDMLKAVETTLAERLAELECMEIRATNGQELAEAMGQLRVHQDELGSRLYKDSKRPGANIYNLQRAEGAFAPGLARSVGAALKAIREASTRDVKRALKAVKAKVIQEDDKD